MSLFDRFKPDDERETSAGVIFGWALVVAVVIAVVAFLIFVAVKTVGGKLDDSNTPNTQIMQEVDTELDID